jgi:hypothetical protein
VRCSHDSGTARPLAGDARGIDGTSHDAGARRARARALPRHHDGSQAASAGRTAIDRLLPVAVLVYAAITIVEGLRVAGVL